MPELASSFTKAQSNIEPSEADRDNAPDAHQQLADVLKADETLSGWGINPFLIGSYGRRVSIRRVYDVDMFCRLDNYEEGTPAEDILDKVYDVLVDEYGEDAVEREDRSITVLIPNADGLYIDVVPARRAGEVWEIPTDDDDWVPTNPVVLADLKEEKNADYAELYVPCVKLLRQARRTLMGRSKPGGFAIEMAFYYACDQGLVTKTSSMAEFFAEAMEGVADTLRRVAYEGFEIPDPSMPTASLEFDADSDFNLAADQFEGASKQAREAFEMEADEAGAAALLLQGILGSNDDFEQVFPMPFGFDDDGTKTEGVVAIAGDRTPSPGPLRFG